MWCCMHNILTEEAQAALLINQKTYDLIINEKPMIVAPLMYKTMMKLATLDGKATGTAL